MKGKRTLLLIVASIVTICVLIGFLKGYDAVWSTWKIPAMTPHFLDLRNLTGGAESISMGYDPLYVNPQDPFGRPMNLPRLVQYILSILKINQDHTTFIGILFILLFFLGIFISLKEINNITALILAAVIFSPSVVLGIERGNPDLFIFFLVSVSLFLSSFPIISMLILLLASYIKLFPVFALSYFFKYAKKTQVVIFFGFIIFFLIYIFLYYSDWPQVFGSTQIGYGILAYGVRTYVKSGATFEFKSDVKMTFTHVIPFAAIIVSTLVFYANSIYAHGFEREDANYVDAFRAGAGIYVGTFFLGNNWVYRLMFLIFVIPQLVSWRNDARRGFISLIALISIIVSCWSMWGDGIISSGWLFAIDEICNWVLFAALFYLLISSMPLFLQKGMIGVVSLTNSCTGRIGSLWLRLKTIYRSAGKGRPTHAGGDSAYRRS